MPWERFHETRRCAGRRHSSGNHRSHLGGKLGENSIVDAGRQLRTSVDAMLASAATRTRDLGGTLTTSAFADAVAKHIVG
jgi:hypothetical protein